jgi:hypothetical protein
MVKLNPKRVEDLCFEEKEDIVKKINFKFIDELDDDEYKRFIIRNSNKITDILKSKRNLKKILKHIRFGILLKDQIKDIIDSIKESGNINNDVTIELVAKLLSELPVDEFKSILAQNPFIQELINSKVINQLKDLNQFKDECELFMYNLNTLLEEYEEERGDET